MIYKSYYKTSNINYYNYIIFKEVFNLYFNLNGPVKIATDASLKLYMYGVKPFPTYYVKHCSHGANELIFSISQLLYTRK